MKNFLLILSTSVIAALAATGFVGARSTAVTTRTLVSVFHVDEKGTSCPIHAVGERCLDSGHWLIGIGEKNYHLSELRDAKQAIAALATTSEASLQGNFVPSNAVILCVEKGAPFVAGKRIQDQCLASGILCMTARSTSHRSARIVEVHVELNCDPKTSSLSRTVGEKDANDDAMAVDLVRTIVKTERRSGDDVAVIVVVAANSIAPWEAVVALADSMASSDVDGVQTVVRG